MAVSGNTEVALTIQKVVSQLLTQTLIQESVALAMPGVWDRSAEVMPGMDRLDMISLAELAVQDVNEDGTAMTSQTITPAAAQLLLSRHKSVPFSITKRGDLQSKIALVQNTVSNGIKSLAAEVDNAIFTEAVANALTTQTVAAADGLAAIRDAAKALDNAKVPEFGRAIAVSPGFMFDDLLSVGNVIRANEFGSSDPLRKAAVADIYGMLVFKSTSSAIPDDGFVAIGMEGLAFARQRQMEFEDEKKVFEQRTDYSLSHLYGVESTAASNPRIYVYNPA